VIFPVCCLRRTLIRCAAIGLGIASSAAQAPPLRWQVQYFYDEAKTSLVFYDIQFVSAGRGMAVGSIVEGKSRKPVSLVTQDGGAHWQLVPIEENPVSVFFLNESVGWMLTEKGIWHTEEFGKDWRKLPRPPAQPVRVYFTDENNGWAACMKKAVLVTHDGGRKWEPVPAAAEPPGAAERSAYTWISFASPKYGIITGLNQPVQRWVPMFPTWLDPEDALSRRETAHLSYALITNDGGKTWKNQSASLIGRITRVRLGADGAGMGLIEYADSFKFPSEVYKIDWKSGKNTTVFRDKRYGISDVWLTPGGAAYLAGAEFPGEVRSVAPGKVKVFKSTDLAEWTDLPVDYRAVSQRVLLAGSGEDVWLATDNGMILKLRTP
jgi:photosystem II stability/assembly factor-like uncharacterized protein